ncbi:hypothetical protein Fmac_028364 [Flemingia macrophylla]|uniref:Uncharacterized protein n=1 Tax=Flemingia macrophylla TaxID=520843 RepID=A0ABD1L798_9FABA
MDMSFAPMVTKMVLFIFWDLGEGKCLSSLEVDYIIHSLYFSLNSFLFILTSVNSNFFSFLIGHSLLAALMAFQSLLWANGLLAALMG